MTYGCAQIRPRVRILDQRPGTDLPFVGELSVPGRRTSTGETNNYPKNRHTWKGCSTSSPAPAYSSIHRPDPSRSGDHRSLGVGSPLPRPSCWEDRMKDDLKRSVVAFERYARSEVSARPTLRACSTSKPGATYRANGRGRPGLWPASGGRRGTRGERWGRSSAAPLPGRGPIDEPTSPCSTCRASQSSPRPQWREDAPCGWGPERPRLAARRKLQAGRRGHAEHETGNVETKLETRF